MNIEALGVTQEELRQMVIEKIVERFEMHEISSYDQIESSVHSKMQARIDERLDVFIAESLPSVVDGAIKSAKILQPRNRYGEPEKPPITFAEYICTYAEKWLTETVDHWGSHRSGSGYQPRIVWMVDQMLQTQVENSIKEVLKGAHTILGNSIQAVVVDALKRITEAVKVQVK